MNTQTPSDRHYLNTIGESDWAYTRTALRMASYRLVTAAVLLIHAVLPCCLERTGSARIRTMGRFVNQRHPIRGTDGGC